MDRRVVGRVRDVQRLGEPSWNLRISGGGVLDALLYLRDALRLPADPALDPPAWPVPFALPWPRNSERGTGPRHDVEGAHEATLQSTTAAWRSWWRDRVAREFLSQNVNLQHSTLAPAWAAGVTPAPWREPTTLADLTPEAVRQRLEPLADHQRALSTRDLGGPPKFTALADSVLRQGAIARWDAAWEWSQQREADWDGDPQTWEAQTDPSLPSNALDHEFYRRTAHAAAFDAGVAIDQMRVDLLMIEAPTAWSQLWAPGAMLVSRRALADPDTAHPVIYAAFRSAAVI